MRTNQRNLTSLRLKSTHHREASIRQMLDIKTQAVAVDDVLETFDQVAVLIVAKQDRCQDSVTESSQ